jgi:hypothetical protein
MKSDFKQFVSKLFLDEACAKSDGDRHGRVINPVDHLPDMIG